MLVIKLKKCFKRSYVNYLHHVGPEFLLVVYALHLDDLEDSGGEGVIVDPPASPEGGGHDGGLGHEIHAGQVAHGLSDLPAVNVGPIEERLVAGVELSIGLLNFATHHSNS